MARAAAFLLRLDDGEAAAAAASAAEEPVKALARVAEFNDSVQVLEPGVYVIRYSNVYSYWKEKCVGHFHIVKE